MEELTFTTASGVENLDENTTVDVGDFLAFYTGESYTTETAASDGYGRITAVDYTTDELGSDYYQLTYTDATKDDVLSSMDVDTTDPISGDAMLDGVDTQKLEEQIAQSSHRKRLCPDCSGPHFRGDRRDGSERPDGR